MKREGGAAWTETGQETDAQSEVWPEAKGQSREDTGCRAAAFFISKDDNLAAHQLLRG